MIIPLSYHFSFLQLINSFANLQEDVSEVKKELAEFKLRVEKNTFEIESVVSRLQSNPASSIAAASEDLCLQGLSRKVQEKQGNFPSFKLTR